MAFALSLTLLALVFRLTPSHQAKSYGEDDQDDNSTYKFHTLNLHTLLP
jgi:hypothetical protein